jgi:D-amino-acid dehydrogenase
VLNLSKIAIVGAGVTGVTSAYALLKRGHDVIIIDRHRYPAMETSYANGGQLSASNAEVWNSWSTIMKGLRWMLRANAPLLLNPTPSWHKYSWLAEFCGQIGDYRENTLTTTRLAIEARAHLLETAQTEGIEFDLERRGILHLYYDKPSFQKAAAANVVLRDGGLDRFAVTVDEIHAIEPTIQGDLYGGFYTPSDATGDIHKFTRGLAAACERLGAVFHQGAEVKSIKPHSSGVTIWLDGGAEPAIEADAVVICAGVESRRLAASLGDRINIYPVKGYSITVNMADQASQLAAPWVSLLDEDAKIVTSRLGRDRFRIAGTAEFNGFNRDIRSDRIRPLIDWCERLFPEVSTGSVVPWSGLRPMTPTMLPRVGPGRHPRVFYNTGHGHLGWTLSAATAPIVSASIDQALGRAA